MKKLLIVSFLILIILPAIKAEDYFVDTSQGNDENVGTSTFPFATLKKALEIVETLSEGSTITLIGNSIYTIFPNNIEEYIANREVAYTKLFAPSNNLIIKGNDPTSKSIIEWDTKNSYKYGTDTVLYHDDWYCTTLAKNGTSVTFENIEFYFNEIFGFISTKGFITESSGKITLNNCSLHSIANIVSPEFSYWFSNGGESIDVPNCYFEEVESPNSSMATLVDDTEGSVSINPLYFSEEMEIPYYIYEGKETSNNLYFPLPGDEDNILISNIYSSTEAISITGGYNYGEILVTESRDIETTMLSVNELIIASKANTTLTGNYYVDMLTLEDNSYLAAGDLTITGDVSVEGDVYIDTEEVFGNIPVAYELEFTGGAYRYFTPPFDVVLNNQFGTVITEDYNNSNSSSVWLFEYNENSKSLGQEPWEGIQTGETLYAGKGYAIWCNSAKTVVLEEKSSFPIVSDKISSNISYSSNNLNLDGYNYVGNPYSLPLQLDDNADIEEYQYYDGSNYQVKSNGIVVGDFNDIPSNGAFFLRASSTVSDIFSYENLVKNSSIVRLKASSENSLNYLRLSLIQNDDVDETVVRFEEEGLFTYDSYDVSKMYLPQGNIKSMLSTASISNEGDYVIQSLPSLSDMILNDRVELPLRIQSLTAGTHQLKLDFNNIENDELSLFFQDSHAGTETELTIESTIDLELPANSDEKDRYSLIIQIDKPTGLKKEFSSNPEIRLEGHELVVYTHESTTGELVLYNINGIKILEKTVTNADKISTQNLHSGVYIYVFTTEDGVQFKDKIVL